MRTLLPKLFAALLLLAPRPTAAADETPKAFFEKHCTECHDAVTRRGGLDLTALKPTFADADDFARWVKIHDRIASGEMPPKKQPRPAATEIATVTKWLHQSLLTADRTRLDREGRTGLRRLTRAEYENTVRDLFGMPGIALQGGLPADGSAHGFDKNADALDISHVNLAKYVEAADHALDLAIATRPQAPKVVPQRISLATQYIVQVILSNGDAVLLKDKQPDPDFPPAGEQGHIDHGGSQPDEIVLRAEHGGCLPS